MVVVAMGDLQALKSLLTAKPKKALSRDSCVNGKLRKTSAVMEASSFVSVQSVSFLLIV